MVIAIVRIVLIVVSLAIWHWTQKLLARRNPVAPPGEPARPGRSSPGINPGLVSEELENRIESPEQYRGETPRLSLEKDVITDGIHRLTVRFNQRLLDHPRQANALLIASSLVIDLLGIYLLVSAVIGPSIAPFLGLFMVFGLRQIVQAFCPLPPPRGMIWRSPGVPSLLVTYGTSCDLFFSGHTAIAVFGCATLADVLGTPGIAIGCAIVAFEIWAVLALRAHYTMDVFTGALAALYVHRLALEFAPQVDAWIGHLVGSR